LAIAGPAQAIAGGEAPGQTLEDDPITGTTNEGILVRAPGNVDIMDACENAQSDTLTGHYIFGTLDELFTQQVTAPYGGGTASTCTYPAGDVDRKAAGFFQGGYIDIPNVVRGSDCADGACVTRAGAQQLNIERGLVGVLLQSTATRGDATRLWGDCSFGDGNGTSVRGSDDATNPRQNACRQSFSLVDSVSHFDLRP
jgi:hypothetical protein